MHRQKFIIGVIALCVVGGGAFYAGMSYGKSSTARQPERSAFGQGLTGRTTAMAGQARGSFNGGKIVSVSPNSISIQSPMSSSTQIVLLSEQTKIFKSVSGNHTDLTVGADITVTGPANSDSSVSAQTIQVRPSGIPIR